MAEAFFGAEIYDDRIDRSGEIVGIYEKTIRDPEGAMLDTKVVVDIDYEGYDDLVSVELETFRADPDIEVVNIPEDPLQQ